MKKFFITIFFMGLMFSSASAFAALPPISESQAFMRYQKRMKSELSKLIYLLERFNVPEMEVKIDGNTFRSDVAFPFAKAYLAVYYRKEKAEDWIKKYCYRSPFTNQIMLGCVKDEKCIPGRDMLLNELDELKKAEQALNAARH